MNTPMSDEVLISLGFRRTMRPGLEEPTWTHARSNGLCYFHILTPDQVAEALIEIGREEFRKKAIATLVDLDVDDKPERYDD